MAAKIMRTLIVSSWILTPTFHPSPGVQVCP